MPDSTTKSTSSKPSSSGKSKPKQKAPETAAAPKLTGEPKLTGAYKAVTCLKYSSTGNGKTINAMPGAVLRDLSEKDIAKFRESGAITLLIEG